MLAAGCWLTGWVVAGWVGEWLGAGCGWVWHLAAWPRGRVCLRPTINPKPENINSTTVNCVSGFDRHSFWPNMDDVFTGFRTDDVKN